MPRPLFVRTVTLFAVLALAGCAGTERVQTERAAQPAPEATAAEASSEDAELEALYWERQEEARSQFTEADVEFMVGMIGHHAQALIMSRLAPTNEASTSVRTLAARIINAQRDEIETMQTWLRDRDQPVPEVHIDGLNLMIHIEEGERGGMDHGNHGGMDHGSMSHGEMDHGGMDHSDMPGMLSQAQLEELAAARGPEFDRLFLTYMIQHHGGAVVMVDDLFATDGAGQDEAAFKLASDINADQTTEIARMELMLSQLPDAAD
jgi:uncharacterized protein (DUF305 family)